VAELASAGYLIGRFGASKPPGFHLSTDGGVEQSVRDIRQVVSGTGSVLPVDHHGPDFAPRRGPPCAALVAWTLLYDEVIFVIQGYFELQVNGQLYRVEPGQLLWIPEGTELVYGGHALFG
jgi:mannose-6-phosphate isomerase-like protein (cupin superfamily)